MFSDEGEVDSGTIRRVWRHQTGRMEALCDERYATSAKLVKSETLTLVNSETLR